MTVCVNNSLVHLGLPGGSKSGFRLVTAQLFEFLAQLGNFVTQIRYGFVLTCDYR